MPIKLYVVLYKQRFSLILKVAELHKESTHKSAASIQASIPSKLETFPCF